MLPLDGSYEMQDVLIPNFSDGMHNIIYSEQPITYGYYQQTTSSGSETVKTVNLKPVDANEDTMAGIRDSASYLMEQGRQAGQIALLSSLRPKKVGYQKGGGSRKGGGTGKGKKRYYTGRSGGAGRAEQGLPIHRPGVDLVGFMDGIDPANRLRSSVRSYFNAPYR